MNMEHQYYFSTQFEPESADNELLAGRCIAAMHGFMSNARNQHFRHTVGIAFPKWDRNTIGNVVCFFSQHRDILTGLSFQPYFSTMVNEEIFVLTDIQEVPATSDRVRFVRNRTIGKSFIGSKKRRVERVLRRAGERNEIHLPVLLEQREFDLRAFRILCQLILAKYLRRHPSDLQNESPVETMSYSNSVLALSIC
ncbi:type I-F CRISPR-associated endoribonuclease Cas6/Csy4 [Vibrio sp. ABG19]|uniref:type I-F CRISPR-associated endoribonuclease Cas6/Csy4 n=1 Tax=Vibrio sp. ABG19 TaxID=2817385 RepID=UPI00249DA599|nr:type I-F CRISPR-associated endoribonuclease Cas6/Csy4 [Vibrio sp. ABG19]WGY47396.1 type I-F CRISPR-associated endoribonuclease Cas6/Csy4 [Vibrio sp. ABG19]